MICEPCTGKGWILHRTRTAVGCPICGGKGELTWGAIARKINEDPATLARVRQGRSRSKTCRRVLDKIQKLFGPKKQEELFT